MKNNEQSKNRFPLSEKSPSDFQQYARSNEELRCADIAAQLGEPNMRFYLARLHQFGGDVYPFEEVYAIVKDEIRNGNCKTPRNLFNFLLTKKLKEKMNNKINH